MGSGGSKGLGPESERIPDRLWPLFRRRYEEIKKRDSNRHISPYGTPKDTTSLSKKELLPIKDNDNILSDDQMISESSEEDSLKVVTEDIVIEMEKAHLATDKPQGEETQVKAEIPKLPSPLADHKAKDNDDPINVPLDQTSKSEDEGIVSKDGKATGEEIDESEKEGRINIMEGRQFWPGPPSFKVYLPDLHKDGHDEEEADKDVDVKDGEKDIVSQSELEDETDKKSQGENEKSLEALESVDSNEGSVTKVKKRKRRGMKFKRVIRKPRTGAMKNLLNVKSCYYPACYGHDHSRLLEQKVEA